MVSSDVTRAKQQPTEELQRTKEYTKADYSLRATVATYLRPSHKLRGNHWHSTRKLANESRRGDADLPGAMLCLSQGVIMDAWRETSRRSSGPWQPCAPADRTCVQRASRARPCSIRGRRQIVSPRSRPMSSIEWLITDPRCLNSGTAGAAPLPSRLGEPLPRANPSRPINKPGRHKSTCQPSCLPCAAPLPT